VRALLEVTTVTYFAKDPQAMRSQALSEAVAAARRDAEAMAQAGGGRLSLTNIGPGNACREASEFALLVAKLSAGRAQDLIDVDALRESDQSQEIEQQQRPVSPVTSAKRT
jgi:Protein of unknown function (DUF541)